MTGTIPPPDEDQPADWGQPNDEPDDRYADDEDEGPFDDDAEGEDDQQ